MGTTKREVSKEGQMRLIQEDLAEENVLRGYTKAVLTKQLSSFLSSASQSKELRAADTEKSVAVRGSDDAPSFLFHTGD